MLEWTGERFIPGEGGAAIFYEHAHRYQLAQSLAAQQRVVDLASGEGYGSDLLARRAEWVVGLELDRNAVAHAARKYRRDNLRFVGADIRVAPLRAGQFDLAVCFEAIEHVARQEDVLSEARRLLRDDGVLVISTPERKAYSDSRGYTNAFHEHEFYLDKFREFLGRVFPCVEIIGQRLLAVSAMWPLAGPAPSVLATADVPCLRPDGEFSEREENGLPAPQYCVAICGGPEARVPERLAPSLSVFVDPDQAWIEEHEDTVKVRGQLVERVFELETHGEVLVSVKGDLEERLAQEESRAQTLTDQVLLARHTIRALQESTSWRITRPLRALSRSRPWRRHAS